MDFSHIVLMKTSFCSKKSVGIITSYNNVLRLEDPDVAVNGSLCPGIILNILHRSHCRIRAKKVNQRERERDLSFKFH